MSQGFEQGLKSSLLDLKSSLLETQPQVLEQLNKVNSLHNEIAEKVKDLQNANKTREEMEAGIKALNEKNEELLKSQALAFLLERVTPSAHEILRRDTEFAKRFSSGQQCKAFVMSLDIRRSTDLMLKAKEPQLFAEFMTDFCLQLQLLVTDNYGVFDKFTGDGILAFFPDFFSGDDAGFRAISVATQAQQLFAKHYRDSRSLFTTVLHDVGLGIGLDYGTVHVIPMAGGLTVVGAAVVYACRLGGAPAGKTLLNQPAYDEVSAKYSHLCFISETELNIKNEGRILCYELTLTGREFSPKDPDWLKVSPEEVSANVEA